MTFEIESASVSSIEFFAESIGVLWVRVDVLFKETGSERVVPKIFLQVPVPIRPEWTLEQIKEEVLNQAAEMMQSAAGHLTKRVGQG